MNLHDAIGTRLTTLRNGWAQTQSELAADLSSSEALINSVENGKQYPDARLLEKLATVKNVDLNWLLTGIVRVPSTQVHENLIAEFNALTNDAERWAWVEANQSIYNINVLLEASSTYIDIGGLQAVFDTALPTAEPTPTLLTGLGITHEITATPPSP